MKQPGFVWNRYRDITVSPSTLYTHPADFYAQIKQAIAHWHKISVNGVWLKLPVRMCNLIPEAIRLGFHNHHCTPAYFMLTRWMGRGESKFPGYGTHLARVEALVTRERDGHTEFLMVKELYNSATTRWNFINGTCKIGEFLADAVRREVKEEVGLDVEIRGLVGIGDRTFVKFGHSELLACFHCVPVDDGDPLVPQSDEISVARWIRDPKLHRDVERVWKASSTDGLHPIVLHDHRGYGRSIHCYHSGSINN